MWSTGRQLRCAPLAPITTSVSYQWSNDLRSITCPQWILSTRAGYKTCASHLRQSSAHWSRRPRTDSAKCFYAGDGHAADQGYVADYADDFSQVLEGASDAVKAGLLEVRSTFQQESKGHLTIGAIPTGGYPLNIPFVFWLYRSMANDQGFLNDAIQADHSDLIGLIPESDTLALDDMCCQYWSRYS